MRKTAGLLAAVAYAAIGLVHVYWAFGGQRGSAAAVPEVNGAAAFRPGRKATIAVALALFGATAVALSRTRTAASGHYGLIATKGGTALAAVMALRAVGDFRHVGFFKRSTDTAFAKRDTRIYSPLCAALALLTLAAGP